MEFLVRQTVRGTHDPAQLAAREAVRPAERAYAMKLRSEGALLRLWRVPGTRDAIGLYETPDATALHDILAGLPSFPWLEITIEALATHPQEQA